MKKHIRTERRNRGKEYGRRLAALLLAGILSLNTGSLQMLTADAQTDTTAENQTADIYIQGDADVTLQGDVSQGNVSQEGALQGDVSQGSVSQENAVQDADAVTQPVDIQTTLKEVSLAAAVAQFAAQTAEEGTLQHLINQAGETAAVITLEQDYTENIVILDNQDITLDLNGHAITVAETSDGLYAAERSAVTVYGKLTLRDSAGTGRIQGSDGFYAHGVYVTAMSECVMEGGTISGFQTNTSGAGVYMQNNAGFTMRGGSIEGNTAQYYGGGIFAYDGTKLSLEGGRIAANSAASGGGLYVHTYSGTAFTMSGIEIAENAASDSGGGAYFTASFAVQMENVTISGNTAENYGGGFYIATGTTTARNTVNICDSTISGNYIRTAGGGSGAGFWAGKYSDTVLERVTVSGNFNALNGAGFYVSSDSTAEVIDCTISQNIPASSSSANWSGGGIYTGAGLKLTGGLIEENGSKTGGGSGGGVYASGSLEINGTLIQNNKAGYGGGIGFGSSATLLGTTVVKDNEAASGGGGIYSYGGTAELKEAAKVLNNTSSMGGGIRIPYGTCTLRDQTLVQGNIVTSGLFPDGGGIYARRVNLYDDALVEGNSAARQGGGIYTERLVMEGGEVCNNQAKAGGGVWLQNASSQSESVLTGGAISDNTATGGAGAIEIYAGNIEIRGNAVITGNSGSAGGAVYLRAGSVTVDENAIIAENKAASGGGLYMVGGKITIKGGEIAANQATGYGGGVCMTGGTTVMEGGCIMENVALASGGGVFIQSKTTGNGTLFAMTEDGDGLLYGNTAQKSGQDLCVYRKSDITNDSMVETQIDLAAAGTRDLGGTPEKQAWLNETTGEQITESIAYTYDQEYNEADYNANVAYGYTFLKEVTEPEPTAEPTPEPTAEPTPEPTPEPVAQIGSVTYPTVQEAVDAVVEGTETEILMLRDSTELVTIPAGKQVVLDLAGHTLKGTDGNTVTVSADAELTVKDSSASEETEGTGAITGSACGLDISGTVVLESGSIRNCGGGAIVRDGGSLTVKKGARIANNVVKGNGGGVHLQSGAVFELCGGEITGNVTQNSNCNGGGIYAAGSSKVIITDGTISGNKSSSGCGGGIYLCNGSIATMEKGEISECRAGGGIGGSIAMESNSYFTMRGGVIRNNYAANGGAVGMRGSGSFTMTGGIITANLATTGNGGGLYSNASGMFHLSGGSIYGNMCQKTDNTSHDIYVGNNILFEMKNINMETEYGYWEEATVGTILSNEDVNYTGRSKNVYKLTALKKSSGTEVARIGETKYDSVSAAVAAALAMQQEETPVIYLLTDISEKVTIDGQDKALKIDFNGFTWKAANGNVIALNSGSLTLQDISTESDRKKDGIGTLTAEENTYVRGIYAAEGASLTIGSSSGDTLTLSGFNGKTRGGCIYAQNGSLTINGGNIINCSADIGGVVYMGAGGTLTMNGGTITDCSATNGGAIYMGADGTLTMNDGTITDCSASGNGGAVYMAGDSMLTINNGTMSACSTLGNGGAVYMEADGALMMNGGTICGCSAFHGGAVLAEGGTIKMHGGSIIENRASKSGSNSYGGGIYMKVLDASEGEPCLQITGGKINGNSATYGGGVCIASRATSAEDTASVVIRDVQIKENTAGRGGGGVFFWIWSSGVTNSSFDNAQIAGNTADAEGGGGIYYLVSGSGTTNSYFMNTKISGNSTAASGGGIGCVVKASGNSGDSRYAKTKMYIHLNDGCVISDNQALKDSGGVYISSRSGLEAGGETKLTIDGAEISGNTAAGNGGGCRMTLTPGQYNPSGWNIKLEFVRGTVKNNTAGGNGGGFAFYGTTALFDGKDVRIEENTASGTGGGGVYYDGTGGSEHQLLFCNGIVKGNQAARGGGIYAPAATNVVFKGGVIEENTAKYDGGGLNVSNGATLEACTIIGNTAVGSGGGLYASGTTTLEGCTVTGNTAARGGGIAASGTLEITEGEITNNEATGHGGGIGSPDKTTVLLKLKGGEISENKAAAQGGGIYALPNTSEESVFDSVKINSNTAEGSGGGVRLGGSGLLDIKSETTITGNTSGGAGGGIYADGAVAIQLENGSISGNTAAGAGGGICQYHGGIAISGGSIENNNAKGNGGGIYCVTNPGYADERKLTLMTGGTISGNHAGGSGGGICQEHNRRLEIKGGSITGNTAGSNGGGVYSSPNSTCVTLADADGEYPGGWVYNNAAFLGQDFYINYGSSYKTSSVKLRDAAGMTDEERGIQGSGWYDESRELTITGEIDYDPAIRAYPLTLVYADTEAVAAIDGRAYPTVQAALDAVRDGTYPNADAGGVPVIHLLKDVRESVTVQGGVTAVLNLNGHTLEGGAGTAVKCYGELTVRDEPQELTVTDTSLVAELGTFTYPESTETGTITGHTAGSGGGIRVYSGGNVTMESGQIANCSAANGAGVHISYGTFELTGSASINHCSATNGGGAVYISGASAKFLMKGGVLEQNKAASGTVYVSYGTFRMTDGAIRENTVSSAGGAVFMNGVVGTKATITKGLLENNHSDTYGGAIYTNNYSTVTLGAGCIIRGNTVNAASGADATREYTGGALHIYGGTVNIYKGAQITGNSAGKGGGVSLWSGTLNMWGGSISGNLALSGGGIYQRGTNGSVLKMTGGLLAGNISALSTGSDLYSWVSTDSSKAYAKATLLPASEMGDARYNVWRDDTYAGDVRVAPYINQGQNITKELTECRNLQLTAAHYGETQAEETSADLYIKSLQIGSNEDTADGLPPTDGQADGAGSFDNGKNLPDSSGKEKSAYALLLEETEDGAADGKAKESGETYEYNGRIYKKIEYDGKLYERDEAVQWSPGDDSANNNNIVRTYDTVTYQLQAGLAQADERIAQDDTQTAAKKSYRLWLEAALPADSGEASITASSMNASYIEETEEGQILRGYWDISQASGGTETRNVTVTIKNMKNGDKLKPTFKMWLEGNESNTVVRQDGSEESVPAQCEARKLTVSAAARYNIVLKKNSALNYTGYFNLATGAEASEEEMKEAPDDVVYGTLQGYGVTLQLANGSSGKNYLGVEVPTGPISFDLDMRGTVYLDGEPAVDKNGAPIDATPYLWAYKESDSTSYGTGSGRSDRTFKMNWNDEDDLTLNTHYAFDAAPYNSGYDSKCCYSGGVWTATEKGGRGSGSLHMTVSGYTVSSGQKPTQSANGVINSAFNATNVLSFSAGYVQVIYPVRTQDINGAGYVSVQMESAVSGLSAGCASGQEPEGTQSVPEELRLFYGDDYYDADGFQEGAYRQYMVHETKYGDNYLSEETSLYKEAGGGSSGDHFVKTNYFLSVLQTDKDDENIDDNNDVSTLTQSGGTGATSLGAQVYISADVSFGSKAFNTKDETDPHYNPDFDAQKDNVVEYNYLTAFDLLQKFDADAYTPVGGAAVIDQACTYNSTGVMLGGAYNNAFRISGTETETTWSKTKTKQLRLTVLYGAKADGSNWSKDGEGNDAGGVGGSGGMDEATEESLLYFETLDDLYAYFGTDADGEPSGKCVAILYQVRDCCIRRDRSITVSGRMRVTDEFIKTGSTFCTTNDVRGWTTYRPDYKANYSAGALNDILYLDTMIDHPAQAAESGVTVYQNTVKQAYASVSDITEPEKYSCERLDNGYVKTEYNERGFQITGTHVPGWRSGNTLLVRTLDNGITIEVTDMVDISSNSQKSVYYVTNGERTVNYKVTPRIGIPTENLSNETVAGGQVEADVVIHLELPKYLSYDQGTLKFDYSSKSCKYNEGDLVWEVSGPTADADGASVLTLKTTVSDVSKGLPTFTFSGTIGTPGAPAGADVPNGTALTANVSILTEYSSIDDDPHMTNAAKSAQISIIALRETGETIYKTADESITELGEDMVYTLSYENKGYELSDIEFGDILPYNGDYRGTGFNGGYRVTKLELVFPVSLSEENKTSEVRYLGTQIKTPQSAADAPQTDAEALDWMKEGISVSEQGVTAQYNEEERSITYDLEGLNLTRYATGNNSTVYGLYFDMKGIQRGTMQVRITLSPVKKDSTALIQSNDGSTQQGEDIYRNSFIFRSSGFTVTSSASYVKAVSRTISGVAWMDQNRDGLSVEGSADFLSTNRRLQGIDVYLCAKDDGTTPLARDESGEPAAVDTVGGVTYYKVTDVLGSPVEKCVTDENGAYSFDNLAQGTYYLIMKDDGGDYAVMNAYNEFEQPIRFEKLSVTPVRPQVADNQPTSVINKAVPVYDGADTAEAPAALSRAFISRTVSVNAEGEEVGAGSADEASTVQAGIELPAKEAIQQGHYISGNWNAGFYYVDVTLEKEWGNMYAAPTLGTNVSFAVTGTLGGYAYDSAYTLTQTGLKTTDVGATVEKEAVFGTPDHPVYVIDETKDADSMRLTWQLAFEAFQAEGAAGPISYAVRETGAKDAQGNALIGFVRVPDSGNAVHTVDANGINNRYKVQNIQILYQLDVTKLSASKSQTPYRINGAEFTLFSDEACETPVSLPYDAANGAATAGVVRDADGNETGAAGIVSFANLPTGTYYLKETKAPSGYSLNETLYTIGIQYDENGVPQLAVSSDDPEANEALGSVSLETLKTAEDAELSPDAQKTICYRFGFEVANECIYSLPETGGSGVLWYLLVGTGILLAAVLLFRKRNPAGGINP